VSSPFGMYGGYTYESSEARALGSITSESYDYRDQAKLTSKLVNDVSYMASYMRKMQKGIDDASQNFMQQIQSFINDLITLLGGGGDTGFDFGDLKYILQAFGALFGLKPGMPLPVNLMSAAWHFISNYVFPNGDFKEALNQTIDGIIATALDIFGEVPIVGQALQQLAIIISDLRDVLMTIVDSVEKFFAAFNISLGDIQGIGNFFNPLKPIFDALSTALNGVVLPDFAAVLRVIGGWTLPLVNGINDAIGALTYLVKLITGQEDLTKLKKALEDMGKALALDKLLNTAGAIDLVAWAKAFVANIWAELQRLIPFQQLIDDIAKIWSGISSGNTIKNAVDTIANILGVGITAQDSADYANIAVAALKAQTAGGGADEFDYPISPSLPAPWIATYTGSATGTWGPDGNGICKFKPSGTGDREVHYTRNANPMIKADVALTVVITKPPHQDNPPFVLVTAFFWMEIQKNATDKSCIRVKIGKTTAQFESVNAAGTVANLGAVKTLPESKAGDVYELKATGTTLTLIRNGITAATQTFTPLTGRLIGFGAYQPTYTWLNGNPCVEFAGVAWQ